MNAWQIILTALATIAGLCAFGFGLVAMIQATNAAGVTVAHAAKRTGGSRALTVLIWAGYAFILLADRKNPGLFSQIINSIVLALGVAFWVYAIVQMWRVRTARNWALLATGCAAVTFEAFHFAFR